MAVVTYTFVLVIRNGHHRSRAFRRSVVSHQSLAATHASTR
jgi:hypothetical protein